MVKRCDECATPLILTERSLVCPSCGLLHDQEYQIRTPLPGFKQRLGSLMAITNPDPCRATHLNESTQPRYRRLGDLQESIYRGSYIDTFRLARDLRGIAEGLLLPPEAADLTMRLFNDTISKVRNPYNNHALLLAVCFIKVTRGMGNLAPVKIVEVADSFAARGYRFSPRLLVKTLFYANNLMPVIKFRSCEDCVGKVIQRLRQAAFLKMRARAVNLDMEDYLSRLECLSGRLLGGVPPVKRSGRNPFLLAASSVYVSSTIISRDKGIANLFTKTEFSREVGIAEYTLRSHLADIFGKEVGSGILAATAVAP